MIQCCLALVFGFNSFNLCFIARRPKTSLDLVGRWTLDVGRWGGGEGYIVGYFVLQLAMGNLLG